MHIYFSGIGGVGIGPLALVARDMGYEVTGSDSAKSRYTDLITKTGLRVTIGQTTEAIAKVHAEHPIDWLVVTAALPPEHPELQFAQDMGIRVSKRDEFINHILKTKNLKLLAVSGTHGKTNTTGMLIWAFKELEKPVSYAIGTNISFGAFGQYEEDSEYFIYEADEYDRNMLKYQPYLSILTTVDYDHPDSYPTEVDYLDAFTEFARGSGQTVTWKSIATKLGLHAVVAVEDTQVAPIRLIAEHSRRNATLVLEALKKLFPDEKEEHLITVLSNFPGTERRLERLKENLYTDYAHHPVEIRATIQGAQEVNPKVVVVYQPHQNLRQHHMKDEYGDCFTGAQKVYWLPTYLSREPKDIEIIPPGDLISALTNPAIAQPAELNETLITAIRSHLEANELVLVLGAGNVDEWLRNTGLV